MLGRLSPLFVVLVAGSVTASLNMNGFEGRFSREQALELARMQDERIRAAASWRKGSVNSSDHPL